MKRVVSFIFLCFVVLFLYSQEIPFDQLNLTGSALYAATRIKERFPNVIFTGGTRTLDAQARAIAQNIYRSQNSGWVGATYRDSAFIRRLNQEIINNWASIRGSEAMIFQTINKVFESDNAGAKTMSRHLSGYAFDIRVNSVNYNELNSFVRTLPGFHQFLTEEGGLSIWHIEFNEAQIPSESNTAQVLNIEGIWRLADNRMRYIFSGSNFTLQQNTPSGWENVTRGTFSINATRTKFTRNVTHFWEKGTWEAYRGTSTSDMTITGNNRLTISGTGQDGYYSETFIKQ